MQHTSFDVWAYAEQRIRMPPIPEKPRRARWIPEGHSPCIILQRTLLGIWPYGPRQPALEWRCTGPRVSGEHATEATTPGADAQPRTSEPKGVDDSSTTNRPGPSQLQSVGREPDARGLCASLYRQERPEVVERARRQYRDRRRLVSGAGSHRRVDRHQLW